MLRDWLTEVRADLVSNIVQPGRFTTIEQRRHVPYPRAAPNGQLVGIFLDDRRDPTERITVLAEHGEILKNDNGTFLVLQNGSVQRHEVKRARSDHRGVRPLCLRPVAVRRRPAGGQIFGPRALSLAADVRPIRTIRSTSSSRASSAPNCTTG